MLLYDTESYSRLSSGTRLGDHYACCVPNLHEVNEFADILLGEVVAGENDLRDILAVKFLGETMGKSLDGAFRTKI